MKIQHNQFRVNEAWIACRLQTLDTVAGDPVDLYILMDAASGYVFGHLLAIDEVPSAQETQALFKKAYTAKREWPTKLNRREVRSGIAGFPSPS
jgi:hypothetical protein